MQITRSNGESANKNKKIVENAKQKSTRKEKKMYEERNNLNETMSIYTLA